jgi:hypothetical protein
LADALQDTEHLARLAEDLPALARLEGLPRGAVTAINLGEILQSLADAYQPLAERRACA